MAEQDDKPIIADKDIREVVDETLYVYAKGEEIPPVIAEKLGLARKSKPKE